MEQIDGSINCRRKAAGKTFKQMTKQNKKDQNTFCVVIPVNSVFHTPSTRLISLRLRRYKMQAKRGDSTEIHRVCQFHHARGWDRLSGDRRGHSPNPCSVPHPPGPCQSAFCEGQIGVCTFFAVIASQCAHWRGNPPVERGQVTITTKNRATPILPGAFRYIFPLTGGLPHQSADWFAMTGNLGRIPTNTNLPIA